MLNYLCLQKAESINSYLDHIFIEASLSRETLIKENFLVGQVLFTIRFHAVLTERKDIVSYRKYWCFRLPKGTSRDCGRPSVSKHIFIIHTAYPSSYLNLQIRYPNQQMQIMYPANTPRGFHIETTWKRQRGIHVVCL